MLCYTRGQSLSPPLVPPRPSRLRHQTTQRPPSRSGFHFPSKYSCIRLAHNVRHDPAEFPGALGVSCKSRWDRVVVLQQPAQNPCRVTRMIPLPTSVRGAIRYSSIRLPTLAGSQPCQTRQGTVSSCDILPSPTSESMSICRISRCSNRVGWRLFTPMTVIWREERVERDADVGDAWETMFGSKSWSRSSPWYPKMVRTIQAPTPYS